MKSFFHKTIAFLQKYWTLGKEKLAIAVTKTQLLYAKIKKLLIYMKGEVKEHLPVWKEDAELYREEGKDRWRRNKEKFNKNWIDWKQTFSDLDASPEKLHEMLFEDRTVIGRRFEQILIILIISSVMVVALDSVASIHRQFGWLLSTLEWFFTIAFAIEYLLRIYSSPHPIRYATSFFGIIDLVTVLPTFIGLFFPAAHTFLILRVLRVFRVFRLLKLMKMMRASMTITNALKASREKIIVFLIFVLMMVTLMGSFLYIIEAGQNSGFTSIPNSIYWAIVTLTTVGYGDIAPATWLGKMIAACIMIIGYSVIAVPTGIVSSEFMNERKKSNVKKEECNRCGKGAHEQNARYCSQCGERMQVALEAV